MDPKHPESNRNEELHELCIAEIVPSYEEYKIATNKSGKLNAFMMANGITFQNSNEAMMYLLKRDHREIYNLPRKPYNPGILGTICLPPQFLTKIPKVIHYESFSQQREDAVQLSKRRKLDREMIPRDYQEGGELQGDSAERELFDGVKNYLEKSKADALMLFGHAFMHDNSTQEKDCIVINLSKGYIMVIECKSSSRKFNKAITQLKDAKHRVQKVVNSIREIGDRWKFVPYF